MMWNKRIFFLAFCLMLRIGYQRIEKLAVEMLKIKNIYKCGMSTLVVRKKKFTLKQKTEYVRENLHDVLHP